MLCLIHGDDIVSSRKKLEELISNSEWVIQFDGKKSLGQEVLDSIDSKELFTDRKTIIIENFLGLEKKSIDKLTTALPTTEKNNVVDVIIWQEGEINKTILQKFKNAKAFLFKLPKYYFSFLDTVTPNHGIKIHELLYKVYPGISEEQIFYSLIKRIRTLMMIKTGKNQEFSDLKNLASWQASKLHSQANLWNEAQLVKFYKKLFELEVGLKTSDLPLPLIQHLDMLLMRWLN